MKCIVVVSANPVKIAAALDGFRQMFPGEEVVAEGHPAPSGVPDQPTTDAETLRGAANRAAGAKEAKPDADLFVGIEGGIEEKNGAMEAFAWIVVMDRDGRTGKGKTGTFFLPPQVAELIRQGKELGEADDIVFGRTNSKQQNGAVGILTGDVIDRARFYSTAMVLALIPFKNPQLF